MTDDAPMTAEARESLLALVDRAWSLPCVAQVQVLFRHRAHAEVGVFTHEQEGGGKNSEADARTLLISLGAARGELYWNRSTDDAIGLMRWTAHADSGSRLSISVQYAVPEPAMA